MILYLKEIMRQKNISSVELAEKLGVSKATVSYWINGKVFPSQETIVNISKILCVEVWQLFKEPNASTSQSKLYCPHCGKPIAIDIKKGSE